MKQWTTGSGNVLYRLPNHGCNVYLLANQSGCLMVDTGIAWRWKSLRRRLERVCQGRPVEALILTHTHFDHAMNTDRVREAFDPKIIVHEKEAKYLESGWSPLPRGTQWYNKTLMDLVRKIEYPFQGFYSIQGDILINDHFPFNGLGFNAYALHTPGHTAGSVTVVVDDQIALVGDTLMGYVTGHSSPAFADNPEQLITSWRKLLDTGCDLFLPSHGWSIRRSELEALVAKH